MTFFRLKRSDTADNRPDPALLLSGELALNYDSVTGGVYYENQEGTLTKIGPAQVSATAPNSTPAGYAGNALGEFWYDSTNSELNIWDGTQWVTIEAGVIPGTLTYDENGGAKIEGLTTQVAAASFLVLFDDSQVNFNLDSLTYSNGIFTNTSTETRIFSFDYQLNLSSVNGSFDKTPYYIWFQKGAATGLNPATAYGLSSYVYTSTQTNTLTVQSTSWTFTLAPGEFISCWASFNAGVLTIGDSSAGVTSPNATRVNVSEVVGLVTGYQSGGWAEYQFTGTLVTASGDNKFDWNQRVAQGSDFTLTYDATNKTFFNNTGETRTYRFDAVMGGSRYGGTYSETAFWYNKNNYATAGSASRYGMQDFPTPYNPGGLTTQYPAIRTVSWIFTLAPGDNISTWWYSSNLFSINGATTLPAGTIPNNQICKLRITEIQSTQSPNTGGYYNTALSSPQAITANTDTLINWSQADANNISTLAYGSGIFTCSSDNPRTYLISNQTTFDNASTNNSVSTWLQLDQTASSSSARYSYFTGSSGDGTAFTRSYSQVVTLQPGDTFSTWINASVAGDIGVAAFAMTAAASTRLGITDITALLGSRGTINAVIAGVGLSGGGYNGTVTLNLDPATSSLLGGVKAGNNFNIGVDGTLSVVTTSTTGQVLLNETNTFAGDADLTYNPTTNTLTVPVVDNATVDCGAF